MKKSLFSALVLAPVLCVSAAAYIGTAELGVSEAATILVRYNEKIN